MTAITMNQFNLPQSTWRDTAPWWAGALAAHLLIVTLIFFVKPAPVSAPQIMAVSLVSDAPASQQKTITPAREPQLQPQTKVTPVAKTPTLTTTTSPTAISQNQAAAPAPSSTANSSSTATGDGKASNDAPVIGPRFDMAYLNNPRPEYPAMSRRLEEQGTTELRVLVLANGTAGKVEIKKSSGYSRLDNAAIEAVKRWKFVPAKRGDTPVDGTAIIPMPFVLERK